MRDNAAGTVLLEAQRYASRRYRFRASLIANAGGPHLRADERAPLGCRAGEVRVPLHGVDAGRVLWCGGEGKGGEGRTVDRHRVEWS